MASETLLWINNQTGTPADRKWRREKKCSLRVIIIWGPFGSVVNERDNLIISSSADMWLVFNGLKRPDPSDSEVSAQCFFFSASLYYYGEESSSFLFFWFKGSVRKIKVLRSVVNRTQLSGSNSKSFFRMFF